MNSKMSVENLTDEVVVAGSSAVKEPLKIKKSALEITLDIICESKKVGGCAYKNTPSCKRGCNHYAPVAWAVPSSAYSTENVLKSPRGMLTTYMTSFNNHLGVIFGRWSA